MLSAKKKGVGVFSRDYGTNGLISARMHTHNMQTHSDSAFLLIFRFLVFLVKYNYTIN